VRLGSPLNAADNYDIYSNYYHYTSGLYAEDILEEIITAPDGYGAYLFNEPSKQALIDNHLTETFLSVEGSTSNILSPNQSPTNITIRHRLASDVTEGADSIVLDSVEGLPSSGQATLNGDIFTWSAIESGNRLTGISESGGYSLKAHAVGDLFKYTNTYAAGQVWYLTYSNIISTLDSNSITFPFGVSANVLYRDHKYGRFILDTALAQSDVLSYDANYKFKTLQSSGVELNNFQIISKDTPNRFEAIGKLRGYLAPNYIMKTKGSDKIWASYLSQKFNADYNLNLISKLEYIEDEDLFTRVKFFGQNKNPTNIMYNEGVDFFSTGQTYKGYANATQLLFNGKSDNYFIYKSQITGTGSIDATNYVPLVYINGVAIDNNAHLKTAESVTVHVDTETHTDTGCHGISSQQYVKIHTYFYYYVVFPWNSIDPSKPIYLYLSNGTLMKTIAPYDPMMDYANGVFNFGEQDFREDIERISSATFWVKYSTGDVIIDYKNATFSIKKSLINDYLADSVTADFEYWTVMIPIHDIASVIDGRLDTQIQIEFFAEPPSNYPLTILDLGQIYPIQALDILTGFYRPDEYRKYDIAFQATIKYSLNGVDFFDISSETNGVNFTGGKTITFEEKELGAGFQARYLQITLERVERLQLSDEKVLFTYQNDPDLDKYTKYAAGMESVTTTEIVRSYIFPIAIVEISAYNNITLESESKLIPTSTVTTASTYPNSSVLEVSNTYGFEIPESGNPEITAFLGTREFTYTGLTDSTFTGVRFELDSGESTITIPVGTRIFKYQETDTDIYDYNELLPKLGDRLFLENRFSNGYLYDATKLNAMSKAFLSEFVKNHTKVSVDVLYTPYLEVGHTVRVVDTFNNIDRNYFVESIRDSKGLYTLGLAYYPNS
jgi:hypothetical protein